MFLGNPPPLVIRRRRVRFQILRELQSAPCLLAKTFRVISPFLGAGGRGRLAGGRQGKGGESYSDQRGIARKESKGEKEKFYSALGRETCSSVFRYFAVIFSPKIGISNAVLW